MELIKVGTNTYYLKNNTNIGVYKLNDTDVLLIDTGNDASAGKKVIKIIEDMNWHIKGIVNTHSHADHTGGNKVIMDRCNADIYSDFVEKSIIESPILEPALLYGAAPLNELQTKFLMAKPSIVTKSLKDLPSSLTYINLKGHYFDMIGIKTSDDIYFLGDSLFSLETINKYHLFYIYDVQEYLNTLEYLKTLKGKLFIPSHCEASKDITELINANASKIKEICKVIINICVTPSTLEDILSKLFTHYNLEMNITQYYLIKSTLKAYLTYLLNKDELTYEFKDNKMYWQNKNI